MEGGRGHGRGGVTLASGGGGGGGGGIRLWSEPQNLMGYQAV